MTDQTFFAKNVPFTTRGGNADRIRVTARNILYPPPFAMPHLQYAAQPSPSPLAIDTAATHDEEGTVASSNISCGVRFTYSPLLRQQCSAWAAYIMLMELLCSRIHNRGVGKRCGIVAISLAKAANSTLREILAHRPPGGH